MKITLRNRQPDFWLLLTIVLLLGIGTMMVFSASTASSYNMSSSSSAYGILIKQLIFAVLGLVVMILVSLIDYKLIGRFSIVLFGISIALLAAVQIPGLGITHNRAKRWLGFGGFEFQPSEILKVAAVLFLAYVFSHPKIQPKAVTLRGLLIYLLPMGAAFGLLYLQPHVSCIIIVGLTLAVMMFLGGVKLPTFLVLGATAAGGAVVVFMRVKHVATRLFAFLDPFEYASGDGYQVVQSLYAIGSGGLFGRGLGKSVQKYLYLPEPYNDFILSILAEELGFFGVAVVVLLFAIFIWRGYKIAICAPDRFGSLVAAGITTIIATQVVMNIAVVTSSMPVTGISLPFFSYGGTSLLIMMANMGILLNISKQSQYAKF